MILVLVGPELYQLAWDYAGAVNHVLWEDLGGPKPRGTTCAAP
ncbi:hypothetical protein ACIRL0_13055 [Streptomyces sp. NPDC102365]